jgi:hypothetical protein
VDGFWFERLTECAAPICDVEKGDLQAWATCASMACGFELQKCFAMP